MITTYSGSTPVRRPFCSKHRRKFVQTSYALKLQFTGHIFLSPSTAKAHVHPVTYGQPGADPGFRFGGGRSSAEGARIEAPQAPNGGTPSPENFLILGSQNAYFGAFCGPPESDSVVLAMWMIVIIQLSLQLCSHRGNSCRALYRVQYDQ